MVKPVYRQTVMDGKTKYYLFTKRPMRVGHRTSVGKVTSRKTIKKPSLFRRFASW